MFGMIALCGMVVNGAFVLAVTRNRYLAAGEDPDSVTKHAAQRRFRPILLTSLTTFLGLGPMIFEDSIQALFLVPMAISVRHRHAGLRAGDSAADPGGDDGARATLNVASV